jgi:hypothetical protein
MGVGKCGRGVKRNEFLIIMHFLGVNGYHLICLGKYTKYFYTTLNFCPLRSCIRKFIFLQDI